MAEQNTNSLFDVFFDEVMEKPEEKVVPLPPTRPPELMEQQQPEQEQTTQFPQPPVLDDVIEQEPDITRKDETERMLEEQARKRAMSSEARSSIGAPKQASEKTIQLSEDKDFMQDLRTHFYSMSGDDGLQSRDESDLAFLNRYMSDKYRGYINNEYYTYRLVDYLNNANEQDRLAFGRVFSRLEKDAPELFSKTGDPTTFTEKAAILGDAIGYGVASPTSLLSYVAAASLTTGTGGAAAPVAGAAVTAARQGLTSIIRNAIVRGSTKAARALTSKGMIAAQTISAGGLGISEYGLQSAQKHGRMDPKTGNIVLVDENGDPTDFDYFDTDWGSVALNSGIGWIAGIPDGAAGMARASRIKAAGDKWQAKIRGEDTSVNINDYNTLDEYIDATMGNPVTGTVGPEVQAVTDVVETATRTGTRPRPLMETLSDNFIISDNITDAIENDMIRQINNTEVLANVMKFGAKFTKELDRRGLLDTLGEVAAVSYRGYLPKRKGTSSATEVVSNALDGLGKVMEGSAPVKRTRIGGEIIEDTSEEAAEMFVQVVQDTLDKSNLSAEDFIKYMHLHTNGLIKLYDKDAKGSLGDALKVATSQAAKILNVESQVSKILQNNLPQQLEADPILKALLDRAHGDAGTRKGLELWQLAGTTSRVVGKVWAGGLTSQIATTARNVHSGTMGLAIKTGVDLVDTTLSHSRHALNSAVNGNYSWSGIKRGMGEIVEDTFSLIAHTAATVSPSTDIAARQKAIAEASAAYDPSSLRQLRAVSADITGSGGAAKSGAERVADKYIETLNMFNIAADTVLRRAHYMHKLDKGFKQLMRKHRQVHGTEYMDGKYKNVTDFVADGNTVPTELIRDALEAATMETFSNMPKAKLGRVFINTIEKVGLPAKALIPFPRFMVSVIKHGYEYSPLSPVTKMMGQFIPGTDKLSSEQMGEYLSKSIVGTGVFAYASGVLDKRAEEGDPMPFNEVVLYSENNLESIKRNVRQTVGLASKPSPEGKEGIRIDTGPLYPLGKYMAGAKLYRAMTGEDTLTMNEAKKLAELVLAFNTRTGDQLKDATDFAAEKIVSLFEAGGAKFEGKDSVESVLKKERFGEFLGEFIGGFAAFTRQARDLELAFGYNPELVDQRTRYEDVSGTLDTALVKAAGSQPEYVFGYEINKQEGEIKNHLANFGPVRRKLVAHKFAGLTVTRETTEVEDTLKQLNITEKDLLAPSRSARVANSERYYFNVEAYEGLKRIIKSDAFNSEVDINGKPYASLRDKKNDQKKMIMEHAEIFRKSAKDKAKDADQDKADERYRRASEAYNAAMNSGRKLSEEETKKLTYDVVFNKLHGFTGDRAKVKWAEKSKDYDVGPIEDIFRERYEDATARYNRGEFLQMHELLYLLGPTIQEQRSYGYALTELENRTKNVKNRVIDVITNVER